MLFEGEAATNNTSEYEGLLASLRAAMGLGIKRLIVRGNSQLWVNRFKDDYGCPQMQTYVDDVRKLEKYFHALRMEHIPRSKNNVAYELSKIVTRKEKVLGYGTKNTIFSYLR